jgi:hypothetical protein
MVASESASAFLESHGTVARIEAPIDLDRLPFLGVAHVIDRHVVVLTPEDGTASDFSRRPRIFLALAPSYHPMIDANSHARAGIGPAGGIASSEDSGHAGFEVLVDFDATIDGEPSLLGQNQRRPHAQTENKEVYL